MIQRAELQHPPGKTGRVLLRHRVESQRGFERYYISDVVSLEPALAFNSVAQKDATGFSRWMLQFGALYHLSPARAKGQLFVHPAIGFSGGSGGARTLTHLSA